MRFTARQNVRQIIILTIYADNDEEINQLFRVVGSLVRRDRVFGGDQYRIVLTITPENFDLVSRTCREIHEFPPAFQTLVATAAGAQQGEIAPMILNGREDTTVQLLYQNSILTAMADAREAPEIEVTATIGALRMRGEIIRLVNFAQQPHVTRGDAARALIRAPIIAQQAVNFGFGACIARASIIAERALFQARAEEVRLEAESMVEERAQFGIAQRVQFDVATGQFDAARQAQFAADRALFEAVRAPLAAEEQQALYDAAQLEVARAQAEVVRAMNVVIALLVTKSRQPEEPQEQFGAARALFEAVQTAPLGAQEQRERFEAAAQPVAVRAQGEVERAMHLVVELLATQQQPTTNSELNFFTASRSRTPRKDDDDISAAPGYKKY